MSAGPSAFLSCPQFLPDSAHLGRESRVWTLSRGTNGQAQKGQVVLRLESSGAQPAMMSSSYTSESQARHKEQLDSRIYGRRQCSESPCSFCKAASPDSCSSHLPSPPPTWSHLCGRGCLYLQGGWLQRARGVTEAFGGVAEAQAAERRF